MTGLLVALLVFAPLSPPPRSLVEESVPSPSLCSPPGDTALSCFSAQGKLVEGIAAVVGTEPIFLSQIEEEVFSLATALGVAPSDSARMDSLKREALKGLIDQKVLALRAQEEGITVSEETLSQAIEADVERVRSRFGTADEFDQALASSRWGSLSAYRVALRERKRDEILRTRYLQQYQERIRAATISPEEVRAFYEEHRDEFGQRPLMLAAEWLRIRVEPDSATVASSRGRAEAVRGELLAGASFAEMARSESDDPGSRLNGGDLGFLEPGAAVSEFEEVVFSLPAGELSPVFRTPFGFHLARVEERQGDRVRVRHILFRVPVDEEDRQRALELAQDIRAQATAGGSLEELEEVYRGRAIEYEVEEELVPLQALPDELRSLVERLEVGELSELHPLEDAYVIARVTARRDPGPYIFEEVRDRLRAQLAQERGLERFLEELKAGMYIEIKLEELAGGG